MVEYRQSSVTIENGQAATCISEPPHKAATVMRDALYEHFRDRIIHNPALDRTLVSFQANKNTPFYSWFKYREGFSHQLVAYLLEELMPQPGTLFDPFAGAGSAVFAAAELGWKAQGIELLPVGLHAIEARLAAERVEANAFAQTVEQILQLDFAQHYDQAFAFNHIAITKGAYPPSEERKLIGYIGYCSRHIADENCRTLLLFAAFCILEEISYTRKDGQYLRWDARSGRAQGKRAFDKGYIFGFDEAIRIKLRQMVGDLTEPMQQLSFFNGLNGAAERKKLPPGSIDLLAGSCLDLLPTMLPDSIDFVLTSPPYANRYDYTRTYALELVYLGCTGEEVKQLRQSMLSCTVENKDKRAQLRRYYDELRRDADFTRIDAAFRQQAALHEALALLDQYRDAKQLNNPQITRLVRNYFYEMCFVIFELTRVLRPGGVVAMVNDNVRYAGEEIPVDLILSSMAEEFGLTTRHIWTLAVCRRDRLMGSEC